MYGRVISVPLCMARLNMHLSVISSRLTVAFDAPAAGRRTAE
jgi:hypothetical protein